MKQVLLDTNVILRFLRRDDPTQSSQAAALFDEASNGGCKLRFGWHVLAECIWALRHHYDAPRQEIAASLATMIASESVVCEGKAVLLDALERYVSTKLDIVDCMLAAESESGGGVLATFDQEIGKKFTEMTEWEWKV